MKNLLLITIIFVFLITAVFALTTESTQPFTLSDLPPDHWAAKSVYDLVQMGITQGYPDGTFRGNKPITRYETAIFLDKLAKVIGDADLKADLQQLRDQLLALQKREQEKIKFSGDYSGQWKVGNVLSTQGGKRGVIADYRLKLAASTEVAEGVELKVDLDTLDYGFFDDGSQASGNRGALATDLLAVESKIRIDMSEWQLAHPVNLKLTYGPGPKRHIADPTGVVPSEIGVTYRRPNTAIIADTKLFGLNVGAGYLVPAAITPETSGLVNTSWLRGTLGYTFDQFFVFRSLRFDLIGDYMSTGLFSSGERNVKAKLVFSAPLTDKMEAGGSVGLAREQSRMMAEGNLKLNDPLDTGTVITVRAVKIGSGYIDSRFSEQQFDWAGYDYFNRPLESGIFNLGGELVHQISDKAKLVGKGDLRLDNAYRYQGPKASFTAQGGISYNLAPNVDLDAAYRVYQNKKLSDTSDLAAVGLIYRF